MAAKDIQTKARQRAIKLIEEKERRSKANQRAVAGKLPPLLENPWQPTPVENLLRITDKKLHRRLMKAELEALMAASAQPVASLMTRAQKAKTATLDAAIICMIAHRAMRALEHLAAKGNSAVAKELYRTVRLAVANLNDLALSSPSLFMPIARDHVDWPVLYSPHNFFVTDPDHLQDTLKISDGFTLNTFGKWNDRKRGLDLTIPQNYLALRVIQLLMRTRPTPSQTFNSPAVNSTGSEWQEEASRLPPLNKDTVEKWVEVGWKAVMVAYKGHPEKDRFLKTIGNSREEPTDAMKLGRIREQFKIAVDQFAKPGPSQK